MSSILMDAIGLAGRQKKEREEMVTRHRFEHGQLLRRARALMQRPERIEEGQALIYRDELYQVVSREGKNVTLFDVYRQEHKFTDVRDLMQGAWVLVEGDDEDEEE